MIKIIDYDDILSIRCSVSEFIFCTGYCEFKIPFYIGGIKPPRHIDAELRKAEGKVAHQKEDKIEIEKIEKGLIKQLSKEEMFTLLPDVNADILFTREDIITKLLYKTKIDERNIELLLTGRADKILRRDKCLIVSEDKFPKNPSEYLNRDIPFSNQTLQALIYLNSKFKKKDAQITLEDIWECKDITKLAKVGKQFEIPHQQKKWIINIRDKNNNTENNIVRTYQGIQTDQDKMYVEENLKKFIYLVIGKKEKTHHDNIKKCIPCEYSSACKFSLL